jgi:hypothetical protein
MEGLKLRSYVVAGLMLAFAGWVLLTPKPGPVPGRTEKWMETIAPTQVADFRFVQADPSNTDPLCSYKSPKFTYDTLVPTVGILARVYEARGQRFDVNLIASRDKASFHDPRVCFSAQKYDITNEQGITIPTSRGDVPATLAAMTGPDGRPTLAIYFYRGPNGFYGSTTSLKLAMLLNKGLGKSDVDCVFYRFIALDNPDRDALIRFITLYMDKAGTDSGGYF